MALAEREPELRVVALADRFDVSSMTIRRDLQALERQGKLTRVHGGAVLTDRAIEPPATRAQDRRAEKDAIARRAAPLVEPGADVFIGAGSTTHALARRLADGDGARFSTNCLYIAQTLGAMVQHDIHVFGGAYFRSAGTFVGPETIEAIERRRFDLVMIGIDGIDVRYGFLEPMEWQAWLVRTLRRCSDRLAVLADGGKFERRSEFRVLSLDEVDLLVTDRRPPEDALTGLERAGVVVTYGDDA